MPEPICEFCGHTASEHSTMPLVGCCADGRYGLCVCADALAAALSAGPAVSGETRTEGDDA